MLLRIGMVDFSAEDAKDAKWFRDGGFNAGGRNVFSA